jgi:preprotein translocase subunit SecY
MSSDLGRRVVLTIAALLIYRIGTYIPLPGVNLDAWHQLMERRAGGLLDFANMVSGGSIARISIFALNIAPYITAAILMQLALMYVPRVAAVNARGDGGRRTILGWTIALTVLLAAAQAVGIAGTLEGAGSLVASPGLLFRIGVVASLTGGTVFLIWLCELITLRGVGNGLVLLLFVGIVTEVPASIARTFALERGGRITEGAIAALALLAVAVIGFIVVMELARRRVPVEYRDRQIGDRRFGGVAGDLPVKLNGAGVIPFVLASWLLAVLVIVADIAGGFNETWINWITAHFAPGHLGYVVYIVLAIVLLTLVYTAFVLDPQEAAEKLRRCGGVIPGIAPGEATAAHMDFVVSRTAALGAVYLAFICVLPELLFVYVRVPFYFGGVSALVVVGVVLDIYAQVRSDRRIRLGGQGR